MGHEPPFEVAVPARSGNSVLMHVPSIEVRVVSTDNPQPALGKTVSQW